MAIEDVAKQVVAELDIIKTWFAPGSAKHRKITTLSDQLADAAGGRAPVTAGDPNAPTPGPGVRDVVAVDSVGDVEDKPDDEQSL